MPLSEIGRLAATLDRGRTSPVADDVAAVWGFPPGAARFHRSSATHVFAVGDGYLRFAPATDRPYASIAALMRRLNERGNGVAPPVPSLGGRLVETVETRLGAVHAMLIRAAPGEQATVDTLTPGQARAWGAALGRLHSVDPAGTGAPLPEAFAVLRTHEGFDPDVATAVRRLLGRLDELPRDPARYGLVHGDFELDNLAWVGESVVAFDFDDAARGWFAADIGKATSEAPPSLRAMFLDGYRQVRPLPDLASRPLFGALQAATALARLVLDAGVAGTDPGWLVALRGRLDAYVRRQRAIVLHQSVHSRH